MQDTIPPADPLSAAIADYRTAFGQVPPIMGFSVTQQLALIAVLREVIQEGDPVSDEEIRRRMGLNAASARAEL